MNTPSRNLSFFKLSKSILRQGKFKQEEDIYPVPVAVKYKLSAEERKYKLQFTGLPIQGAR